MARLAVMAVPGLRGSFRRQAEELMAQLMCIVRRHQMTLSATTMMVFLRNGADEAECRNVLRSWFGEAMPVTTFVVQPPCSRAALGIELWALGGPGVKLIEWPKREFEQFEDSHVEITIKVRDDGAREITMT